MLQARKECTPKKKSIHIYVRSTYIHVGQQQVIVYSTLAVGSTRNLLSTSKDDAHFLYESAYFSGAVVGLRRYGYMSGW